MRVCTGMVPGSLGFVFQFFRMVCDVSSFQPRSENSAATALVPWRVVMTRPRHELAFVAAAREAGLETYWPAQRVSRRYGAALRSWNRMLFPGYVFARSAAAAEGVFSRRAGHVAKLIEVPDVVAFERQLEDVRTIIAAGIDFAVAGLLTAGRAVRIASGPMRGVVGLIEGPAFRAGEIFVSIEVLGRSVRVPLNGASLEVLP